LKKTIALYIINVETAPNYVISKAFHKAFDVVLEYDWCHIVKQFGLRECHLRFIQKLKELKPEYCFMQIQNPAMMTVEAIREMAKHTNIINWTGDVRDNKEWHDWFEAIGKEIYLTLFTNEKDVVYLKNKGVRTDYLQIGFDNINYNKKNNIGGFPEIVFCCNNYGQFPLSQYRINVAKTLKEHYKEKFYVYGTNWDKYGIKTCSLNNIQEANAYNTCKIAISVSHFAIERYFSDRLLRIMGCGTLPLSHYYPGIEKDFIINKDIVIFNDLKELINKCDYYLENTSERLMIANNAFIKAHNNYTWDYRCKKLLELILKNG